MKTTTTTTILLTAIAVSGLLLSAAAQPAGQPDNNNAAAPPDQVQIQGQPAQGDQGAQRVIIAQPDQGGQAVIIAQPDQGAQAGQIAQPDQATQPEQGALNAQQAMQGDQTQAIPAEERTITSTAIAPRGTAPQTMPSTFVPPATSVGTNQNDLTMNFINAPLDQVLAYLSDAAGFIIELQTRVSGYVTIKGSHITKDEAVNLLNSQLNLNNYAAIRDGRTLTIVNKSDAKTSRIPVLIGNDPTNIPNTDEIATWIVPIRFVEARQLVSDLSLFVSPQATIVANDAGNSIVITDTQANIRHLVQIIQAVDNSAEAETEIRVFKLEHASPVDVANELTSVFPSSSSGSQSPIQFGGARGGRGGGGGGRGGFGGGAGGFGGGRGGFGGGGNPFAALFGGGGNNPTQQRLQKATQVSAVADSRIQAVIVTAPKDLMIEIAQIMDEIDVASDRDQNVATIQLNNADPQAVATVLQSMFSNGSTGRGGNGSSQNSMLQQRAQNATTTMGQTSSSSGIGNSSYGGGGGGGGGRGGF